MYNKIKEAAQAMAVKFYATGSAGGGYIANPNQEGKAQWKEWSTEKAIQEGYKANIYVYACVNRIARSAASVPWKVRDTRTGEFIEGHPLIELINRPNPFMTKKDLIERMTAHLYLGGNSVQQKIKSRGVTVEIWPLSPDKTSPIPSRQDFISRYEYRVGARTYNFEPNEIIHVSFIDPNNVYWGMGPLQAAARTVDTDNEAVDFNKIALQNRAVTDGAFVFKQPITRAQWEDARAMIKEQHQGKQNARQPWVLGSGAEWQQMSMSPAELDFIESRKMTREEICSVFDVPPPLVGILEKANYANMKEARKVFWLDTVIPYLDDIQESLNHALTPEFGPGIELVYDTSNVGAVQDNFSEKVSAAREIWNMGVPFNEVNKRLELGFDEVPGGDTGYLPTSLMPADMDMDALFMNEEAEQEEREEDDEGPKSKGPGEKKGINRAKRRALHWKTVERRRSGWYNKTARAAAKELRNDKDAILKAIDDNGVQGIDQAVAERKTGWGDFYEKQYTAIIEDFGKTEFDQLKSGVQPEQQKATKDVRFDPFDANIQEYIKRVSARKIVQIEETTVKRVKRLLDRGIEENATVDQIKKAIDKLYLDQIIPNRSYVIARTEVVSASNYGSMQGAKQTGLNPKKVWVSSRDDRVRDSHGDADGQERHIDDNFDIGGDLLEHPGDFSGRAENVIQCRCTMEYTTN